MMCGLAALTLNLSILQFGAEVQESVMAIAPTVLDVERGLSTGQADTAAEEKNLDQPEEALAQKQVAMAVKWIGDVPFVQSNETGKVHCGFAQMTIVGKPDDKQVSCDTCACTTPGLTPWTFTACDCPCHLLAEHYNKRRKLD